MSRTTEFVLGLIGGVIGIFAAMIALMIGGIGAEFGASDGNTIIALGWVAVLLAIVGIVGSVIVKFKPKVGGILLLVSGVGGFICISAFWILSGVLLIIGGLMGVVRKNKTNVSVSA